MRKFLIAGVIILIFSIFFLFLRASDSPSFCASCHFMKLYYENWLSSTHNQVPCGECHYAPGTFNYIKGKLRLMTEILRYFVGVYSTEVTSNVNDEVCFKCHKGDDFMDRNIVFSEKDINFVHRVHFLKDKIGFSFRCQNCHSELVQGRHTAVSVRVCILCHFVGRELTGEPKGRCGICHGSPKDDILVWGIPFSHSEYSKNIECRVCHLHTTKGRGDTDRGKCMECHINSPKYVEFEKLHSLHVVNRNIKCFKCHGEIRHGKIEVFRVFSPICQECHGNRHSVQERIYSGSGGVGVPVLPDPMFLSDVMCQGCHSVKKVETEIGTLFELPETSSSACNLCHGEGYDRLLKMWQRLIKERLGKLILRARWLMLVGKFSGSEINREVVKTNLEIVERDGSYGAHNIRYINLLLDAVERELGVADRKPSVEFIYKNNSGCINCHFGIENLSIDVQGRNFPHGVHLFSFTCLKCHSEGKPGGHGDLKPEVLRCNSCHHNAVDEIKCGRCHTLQVDFYEGRGMSNTPDFMSEGDISCEDCHMLDGELPVKPSFQICSACHDDEYVEEFKNIREEIAIIISRWDELFPEVVEMSSEGKLSGEEIIKIENLRREVEFFKMEGSSGAHNLPYRDEFLERVKDFIESFKLKDDS
jgi:nitrate/TMAO reductase-like tetraheme cytochrome c subunit